MKWLASIIGTMVLSTVAAAQAPAPKRSAPRISCSTAPDAIGSRKWIQRHEAMLTEAQQEKLPPGRLVGIVRLVGGEVQPSALVRLQLGVLPGDTAGSRAAVTDRNGVFAIDSVDHQQYILRVVAIGRATQWRQYWGIRGITDTLCIELRPDPIHLDVIHTAPVRKDTMSK